MAVGKVTRNSKKTFFGGKGSLIPLRPRTKKPSQQNSEPSSVPPEWIEQIAQEAREQMGYQPEDEEPSSNTGQDKPDSQE